MLSAKQRIELERQSLIERSVEAGQLLKRKWTREPLVSRVGQAPPGPLQRFNSLLDDLKEPRQFLMFGSNSYLNLNVHPHVVQAVTQAVAEHGVGSGGSPLFSGYTTNHQLLEQRLARLGGHEAALLLPSGYMANICWVSGLVGRNDVLLYDQNSHASVIDGLRMSKGNSKPFDPSDLSAFEDQIQSIKKSARDLGQIFATVEGVRSIDGGMPDLEAFAHICRRHGVLSILDDAHGFGVMGRRGNGTIEHYGLEDSIDFRMSTCSKAIGAQGAFLSGPRVAIEYLRVAANPYMFTTALAQTTVAAIGAALDVIEDDPSLLSTLHKNARMLERALESNGFDVGKTQTGIVPLFTDDVPAELLCSALHDRGLFVNAIEFPLIPSSRRPFIRFSLMVTHSEEDILRAVATLKEAKQGLSNGRAKPSIGFSFRST